MALKSAFGALLERTALRDWRAATALFFVTTALEGLARAHLYAFTPLFLRDELQVPPDAVGPWTGLLASATFAVAFPLAMFWGSLAERYSRRLIIVRSQYLQAAAFFLSALAPDLTWFVAARLLMGLTMGNIAVLLAVQTLITPGRRIATGLALVQASTPIAASLGPPLGALLLPWIGLRGLFLVDGLWSLAAALLITFLMPEPPGRKTTTSVLSHVRASLATVWRRPAVRWNFAAWFLTWGATNLLEVYLPVRIAELAQPDPAPAIGLILGVHGALTTIAIALTGRVVDRVGAARLFWPGMVAATAITLGVALSPWLPALALFAWLRAIPVALTATVLYAHLAQVLGREERAPVFSLTPVPRNSASFSVPLLGAAAATFGTPAALLVAVVAYALAAWAGLRLLAQTPAAQAELRREPTAPS